MLISDKLPSILRDRLVGRDTIRGIVDNSLWLFADQILRTIAGLVVGIWVARFLGPVRFGLLNYASTTAGFTASFATFGINSVVLRKLVHHANDESKLLGTAFVLRGVGAGLGYLVCIVFAYIQPFAAIRGGIIVAITATGLLFQALDVVDLVLQARSESRISAWVRILGCFCASVFKVLLIKGGASLPYFAAAGVLEIAVSGCACWWWARARGVRFGGLDQSLSLRLLKESWPLALSGVASYAQAYGEQFVLAGILGSGELGQYAVAVRCVGAFAFIPVVVQTVAAPEIARARLCDEALYDKRLHALYRTMLGLFFAVGVPLLFFGPQMIRIWFGASYDVAASILPMLILRLFFINFGVARTVFLTTEGLLGFSLVTTAVGAAANIGLNIALVPLWGIKGTVASSLISFAVSTFGLDFYNIRSRKNLRFMTRAIFIPWAGMKKN